MFSRYPGCCRFLTLLLGVMLNLISSMQSSETEGAICKSLCCYHPPNQGKNDLFVRSYFKYGMEFGKPTFVPVQDLEMGFEKIVKIAHSRGVCKQKDAVAKLKVERKRSVQGMDAFLRVVTSIPGIDNHDANALNQAIGSVEAIAKASKEYILENTDLSADKAEIISKFFRDPKFYLSPQINRSEKQFI
ncbi:hypothetical protein SLA2020_435580 [Shorea laevis]